MRKDGGGVRKIACLTREQQAAFDALNTKQKRYIDFRAQGYSKTQSYKMAGYQAANIAQSAYNLEKHPEISDIIQTMQAVRRTQQVVTGEEDADVNREINALALQEGAEHAMGTIMEADGETAQRLQFYRDVASGKIKSIKKTVHKSPEGAVLKTIIEETSNVEVQMKARKELDRILGLNSIIDIGKLQLGAITINIVDASKRDELDDSRNKVALDPDDMEIVDSEPVVVSSVEEKPEKNIYEVAGEQ